MLIKSFFWNKVLQDRFFSSLAPYTLEIGEVLKHSRIFSDDDVIEYSKASHDLNPIHFDPESARRAGFKDRLVHGMLVASLFPWIISSHFPGAIYVSQSLNFKSPVFIGDEITGMVQASYIKENKKNYIAKFTTRCYKNEEILVIDGEATAILPTLTMELVHSTADL